MALEKFGKAYKEAMDRISVSEGEMKIAVKNKIITRAAENVGVQYRDRVFRHRGFAAVLCIILAIILLIAPLGRDSTNITMMVYASDGSIAKLGKEPVILEKNIEYDLGVYVEDDYDKLTGSNVFDFKIICEGEDIETITYDIENEETFDYLSYQNRIWFAEKITVSNTDEYMLPEDEKVYRTIREEEICTVYKYIGSSYIVDAENQMDKNYCIEFETKYKDKKWTAEEFDITVLIKKINGENIKKQLHCTPEFHERNGQIAVELYIEEN